MVKIHDNFAICPNENFKLSTDQLIFDSFSKRKCKILGIITGKVEQSPLEYLGTNPEASKILKSSTDVIMYTSLKELGLIEVGNCVLRPIAIYYEK